jgi:hypothetical protein
MHQHESTHSCQCDVCKVQYFERNSYFHGKMLSARDLKAEQDYFNEKRWLINRMVLGWGIVCGLEVEVKNGCLYVSRGLALDCCGHEILICERKGLHVNKIAEQLKVDPCEPFRPIRWVLCLEYQECKTEPVKLPDACEKEEGGYNRIRDHYRLTFRSWDPDNYNYQSDPDQPCPKDQSDPCCPYDNLGRGSSIHQALLAASRECSKCKDCECIVLATGMLDPNPSRYPEIRLDEDSWKYRRIVYTNAALANLIHCFHVELAHITEINWRPGSNYKVNDFLYLLTDEHLQIKFDKPLNEHTVTEPRTFRLSIFIATDKGNCPVQLLIPVERIEYSYDTATYYFDHRCIENHLRRTCHQLAKPAEVELILHGSMVLDERGRALDAELIGDFPTGNGVQGGEFITYFTVVP